MAYKKFDDPSAKVDASKFGVNDVVPLEALRRALQGISNRVLGGTAGTGYIPTLAGAAVGGSAGFLTAMPVGVVRNGVRSTANATNNMLFGTLGTLGANEVTKFLICTINGTSGTVIGPGNVVSKADYANATLAAAACKLPDLPDGACPLASVTLSAPATTVLVLTDGAATAAASLGYLIGTGGTAGTATYQDLVCMPFDA